MLSVKRTQELLSDKTITYEEAEKIRDGFYALGRIIFEKWIAERKQNKDTKNSE